MAHFCTDAGHGGSDSGAAWGRVLEKDLNLTYVQALNAELKERNHRVLTTRKSDVSVPPLGTRCRLINSHHQQKSPQFDAIVSIHCNVAAILDEDTGTYRAIESRRGFYAIYSQESTKSLKLARSIAAKCAEQDIVLKHNGVLSTVQLGRTLAWIHKTVPPSVLLELGFMTNPEELMLLQDSGYQAMMVKCIADGIENYLNP